VGGVSNEISSARAGAEIIGVVKVGTEVGIATVREIRRTRTGLIVRVSGGFKVKIESFSKSLTLKKASLTIKVFKRLKYKLVML
jgi:hypothetical protein